MIQTLKHESDGKLTFVKETLTLNITLTFRNSRTIEKNVLTIIIYRLCCLLLAQMANK